MKSFIFFFSKLTALKKLLLILTPLFSILVSMQASLIGLLLLILIDLFTGIKKTLHSKGVSFNPLKAIFWQSIKSFLLRQTWKKTYEYGIGIFIFIIFESLIFGQLPIMLITKAFTLTELSIIVCSIIEIYSINENIHAVTGTNFLKRIIPFLPLKLQKLFTNDGDN